MFQKVAKRLIPKPITHQSGQFSKMNILLNSTISLKDYQKLVSETIESISLKTEEFCEDSNIDDYDIVLSEGVLQIQLSKIGTYIISRQTASRELWLSSPTSGPWHYRYDMDNKDWICTRNGEMKFFERINEEFSKIFSKMIKFD